MRISTAKQHKCVRGPLRECRSIRSGASGLPYYCTPLVCISVVIGLLAVWRHNKPKTKKTKVDRLDCQPYYCTSICTRSCCTWRASSVDSKQNKQKKVHRFSLTSTWFVPLSLVRTWFVPLPVCDHSQKVCFPPNRRRSLVFRVLFQQTNKQNK